jgi:hypothetical protein
MGGPGSGRRPGGGKKGSKSEPKQFLRVRVSKGKGKKNFVDKPVKFIRTPSGLPR